jgi:hypothetical protein
MIAMRAKYIKDFFLARGFGFVIHGESSILPVHSDPDRERSEKISAALFLDTLGYDLARDAL